LSCPKNPTTMEVNPVPHGEETVKELTTRLEGFVNKTWPMLKRLGREK